mmetsp:Transcript_53426/g.159462  ORF Transcript_53426/g.159462 Transcript_53426/m.159462 type:complete len:105 (-) Transcript_53426:439-753(-)
MPAWPSGPLQCLQFQHGQPCQGQCLSGPTWCLCASSRCPARAAAGACCDGRRADSAGASATADGPGQFRRLHREFQPADGAVQSLELASASQGNAERLSVGRRW